MQDDEWLALTTHLRALMAHLEGGAEAAEARRMRARPPPPCPICYDTQRSAA